MHFISFIIIIIYTNTCTPHYQVDVDMRLVPACSPCPRLRQQSSHVTAEELKKIQVWSCSQELLLRIDDTVGQKLIFGLHIILLELHFICL